MDEVSRTLDAYESDPDAYVEKYRSVSIAARFGDAFFDALDGDRILDVGCGPGSDLETMVSAGYDATGLDITPSFLRAASDRLPATSLARGDMRRLPFRNGAFDGVWSCASFLHVPRPDAVETLREFRRVLADAGIVYLSVKRSETEPRDGEDRYFEYYGPDELRSALREAALEPRRVDVHENWVSAIAENAGRG
ncbi:class I SAM-dependent methyltransferase [Halosolutus gelatinilyticus]|uniref:class I SAM-dependent methyltransferase n=1 Tax=Halosolutus gelatinilyticus TaxID=2931975 RepID=UPI001FF44522|nr:class I SAM-dependent methyltransferase [Halosolutus gelatinilyticus]